MSVSDIINIAIKIGKTLNDAYGTYEECRGLSVKCRIVRFILEKHPDVLSDDSIQELSHHLRECSQYLDRRQEKSFFRNMAEAMLFPKKIGGYKAQIEQWISVATFSLVGEISAAVTVPRVLPGSQDPLTLATLQNDHTRRQEFLENIPRVLESEIVLRDQRQGFFDGAPASLKGGDKVRLIKMSLKTYDAPKLVQIYATLSGSVSIQRVFGILDFRNGSTSYAVVEDLEEPPFLPLSNAFDRLETTPFIQRLRICYDLALTVASLHKTERVIKVLSDSSIFLREDDGQLIPVLSKLEESRIALSQTTNSDYDPRYNAPECVKSKQHNYKTDIWSLGVVLLQILTAQALPSEFDSHIVLEEFHNVDDRRISEILGSCLDPTPSRRPTAAEVEQRLSDQYADECAKQTPSDISELLEKGKRSIAARRENQCALVDMFSKADVEKLLTFEDSWDDVPRLDDETEVGSPLRLAPRVKFTLGAGILYGLIDLAHIHVRGTVVSRGTTSLEVYRRKIAIYYLTDSVEIGSREASQELVKAHRFLEEWYASNGDETEADKE